MRDTWIDVALTTATKIYWLAVGLGVTVITARVLGPEGRGIVAAASGWVTLFSTVGYLSLSQVVIHEAATRRSTAWVAETTGTLLTIFCVVTACAVTALVLLYRWSDGGFFDHLPGRLLSVAFVALPFMLWFETGNALLLSTGALRLSNIAQTAGATLSIVVVLVSVVVFRWGAAGALLGPIAYYALYAVVSVSVLARRAGIGFPRLKSAVRLLVGGLRLHMNAVGAFLVAGAHVLIVNAYRGPVETAYIQIALQLIMAMQVLPVAVATVAFSLVARKGPDAAWPRHRTLMLMTSLVMAAAIPVFYLIAPWLIRAVAGAEFDASVPLFRVLLLAVPGMSVSVLMTPQWIARGLFLTTAAITMILGSASVAASWVLVPLRGATAASWIIVTVYAASLIISIGFFIVLRMRVAQHSVPEVRR